MKIICPYEDGFLIEDSGSYSAFYLFPSWTVQFILLAIDFGEIPPNIDALEEYLTDVIVPLDSDGNHREIYRLHPRTATAFPIRSKKVFFFTYFFARESTPPPLLVA